jgi:ABC-type lipoprotein export system ATPase subunit
MVEIKGLSYQYESGKAITFPDFQVDRGSHFILLGESGSGKTTLLHLLGGLLKNQTGTIIIDGVDLITLSQSQLDHFRGKRIGFVFQKNHLISSLTVRKNLLLSSYLGGVPRNVAAISETLSHLGIEENLDSKVTQLSQGQLQRVAIARAVINSPTLILADEPTSALDDKNCERVINLLVRAAREHNSSLIIATHDQRLKEVIKNQIHLKS